MWGKVLVRWEYTSLGLRENNYLVAALVLVCVVAAWAVERGLVPRLEGRPITLGVARVGVYTVAFVLVFVFLRPINQFIYFQF